MDQDGQPSIHEDDHRGIVTTALGGSTWNRAQQPLHDAGVSCGRLCAAAVWWMLWEDWGFGVVDLAGRENEQTSECKDERFRELRFINRSLFELANCISALCDGNREHVPFRNSKLTMLPGAQLHQENPRLSDSLSSNSRTTLLATLTPSPTGFDENMLTCRFLESAGVGTRTTCSEVGEPVCHDGLEPLTLRLDEDSVMCYLPQLLESPSRATSCYTALAETLQRLLATVPAPPKDSSSENDRAQFYGSGSFGKGDFRFNPRWCLAGRALEDENSKEVLYLKERVEEETLRTLQGLPDECREVAHGLSEQAESLGSELEPFFNSVLVNFYLDGRAQIKWHADDENCYGPAERIVIGSVSLGAPRPFELRRTPRKGDGRNAQERRRIWLQPGSLLIMAGAMQAKWQHSLPAETRTQVVRPGSCIDRTAR
ncbi:Kinesin-like protein KIF18B [Durusdinium trenchii]|uniref:Kinesin-like protein KIF18B n=1 Tax=Durusdinium trenchii TaxID=1381693 RepID=A0ABP0QKJ4_9DINO